MEQPEIRVMPFLEFKATVDLSEWKDKDKDDAELICLHGYQVIAAVAATGERYLELCSAIRTHKISPKVVSKTLLAVGFNRQVVSRINKVAQAKDEDWEAYKARSIGFNQCLELTRGKDNAPTPATAMIPEYTPELAITNGGKSSKPAKPQEEQDAGKMNRACKVALAKFAALGEQTLRVETDYAILTIKKKVPKKEK